MLKVFVLERVIPFLLNKIVEQLKREVRKTKFSSGLTKHGQQKLVSTLAWIIVARPCIEKVPTHKCFHEVTGPASGRAQVILVNRGGECASTVSLGNYQSLHQER